MSVAFALSGGGARGDFEVGALRFLYDKGIRPNLICGCSVGAINGVKLAEGKGPAAGEQALKGLENIWNTLVDNNDMWLEEPWLSSIADSRVTEFLLKSAADRAATAAIAVGKFILFPHLALLDLLNAGVDLIELKSAIETANQAKSVYNLNPISAKLRDPQNLDASLVSTSGVLLRLATVSLESGSLRYVTESGQLLERNNDTLNLGQIVVLNPKCQAIAAEIAALRVEKADVQAELSVAAPPQKSDLVRRIGELSDTIQKMTQQLAVCKSQHPSTTSPATVDLLDGVLASASIPFVFPPVKLGGEHYVDGGVREVLPLQVALDTELNSTTHARADTVYAIVASATGVPVATKFTTGASLASFETANLLDIGQRVAEEIMPEETLLNETDPPRGWGNGVTVIQPNFDIHDIMTIDPGLIQIRMAHGYMRADDVYQAKSQEPDERKYRQLADQFSEQRKTNQIIRLRKTIWDVEYAANGRKQGKTRQEETTLPSGADPSALAAVRQMKRDLKKLVADRQRLGGAMPASVETWWLNWERHKWSPIRDLWDNQTPFNRLTVSVDPTSIPMGTQVMVTVRAKDFDNGSPVSGKVKITNYTTQGRKVTDEFEADSPFPYTFRQKKKRTRRPGGGFDFDLVDPTGALRPVDPSYPEANVPFAFDGP